MCPPHIVMFLNREPFDLNRYELLAYYYRLKEEYEEAAEVYQILARIQ